MKKAVFIPLLTIIALTVGGEILLSPYGGLWAFLKSGLILHPKSVTAGFRKGPQPQSSLDQIRLPDGFRIEIYTSQVPGARSMTLGPDNLLFVGTRSQGRIYAVTDADGDYKADQTRVLASGLNSPNGVALHENSLYVAEISRILRFDNIHQSLQNPPEPVVINDKDFPREGHHGWKFIAIGPDEKLYVPIGAPCNVCSRGDPFASITRINLDGTGFEIFARGVRNTVGFDWHPESGVLWFTDNGRDWMGDNRPPDELNKAPEKGLHFGFPFIHGDIKDPEYGGKGPGGYTAPELELGPHVAALGMRFYTGDMFPKKYQGDIFIAEHGSWNRSVPIGYRVMRVHMRDKQAVSKEVFAAGWLQDSDSWGRPVDVLVFTDGSLLISDDKSGTIYRITYEK